MTLPRPLLRDLSPSTAIAPDRVMATATNGVSTPS